MADCNSAKQDRGNQGDNPDERSKASRQGFSPQVVQPLLVVLI